MSVRTAVILLVAVLVIVLLVSCTPSSTPHAPSAHPHHTPTTGAASTPTTPPPLATSTRAALRVLRAETPFFRDETNHLILTTTTHICSALADHMPVQDVIAHATHDTHIPPRAAGGLVAFATYTHCPMHHDKAMQWGSG